MLRQILFCLFIMNTSESTFWEHLEVLRTCLWKILLAVTVGGVGAFCLKEQMFDLVLAPTRADFVSYRLLFGSSAMGGNLHLINTGLAEQMMIHLKVAVCMGVLVASPYIIYVLFGFISPALYEHERRYSVRLTLFAYIMFVIGLLVNYLLIFPLTVHFLGTYQVTPDIDNMLTISSYIDTMLMMTLVFGIVFEIPVLSWLMAKFGLLRSQWMSQYRRHAIVVILIVAAVITPTADMFTLIVVSLPIWLLYEFSIYIVRYVEKD